MKTHLTRPGGTTRRNFLKLGAAGGVAVAGLSHVRPAGAQPPVPFLLTITDGDVKMVDGTLVFFRGFRPTSSTVDVPQIPGPPIGNVGPGIKGREVFEGDAMQVIVANSTGRDHTFVIERSASETPVNPVVGPVTIPAHGSKTLDFTAPDAGSYIYRDADRNNRLLGMYGAFIVEPTGTQGELAPYSPAPDRLEITTELRSSMTWVLSDVDPVLGELARTQPKADTVDYPLSRILPRYFLINGQTGVDATRNAEFTIPVIPLQAPADLFTGVLIHCVNTGVAAHSLHWHGNHVLPVETNAVPQQAGLVLERDVVEVMPLERIDVILPAHTGFDSFPPLSQNPKKVQKYPMHCHAEMSQTAGGGSYPFGMLTDWHLVETAAAAQAATQELAEAAKEGRKQVPEDQVQAAIDQVVKSNSGPGGSGDGKGNGSGNGKGSGGAPGKD